MPGFQTKPLTITIVSGNDSRIFPRNVMACFTHVLSQSWFWAVKIRNSPLMFFQTCAKLAFCLTQIYFLAITAWWLIIMRHSSNGLSEWLFKCTKTVCFFILRCSLILDPTVRPVSPIYIILQFEHIIWSHKVCEWTLHLCEWTIETTSIVCYTQFGNIEHQNPFHEWSAVIESICALKGKT